MSKPKPAAKSEPTVRARTKESGKIDWSSLWRSENWWTVWFGFILVLLCFGGLINFVPQPQTWVWNPLSAISADTILPLIVLALGLLVMFSVGIKFMKGNPTNFVPAFIMLFLLGVLAQLIGKQEVVKSYGLSYVLWALVIGIVISNTIGLPKWFKPAIKEGLYIKTGLVILGAEIIFGSILKLGVQGLLLAWGVTPIVLIFIYWYGTKRLKLERTLSLLIGAATAVCGVSAAIAISAACRAKKEYLTLAISISLMATVIMMVGLPALIKTFGIDLVVGGAWIGGTVDSTGAVAAAGELLGQEALEVAAVIKLIQNVMIGAIAFIVAFIWATRIEKDIGGSKPGVIEVWYRLPKFVLGFIVLSLITSFVFLPLMGEVAVGNVLNIIKGLRVYFFGLAFLSIGLSTDLRELKEHMSGGNAVQLYIVGQIINIVLTFLFAWLLFGNVLF